MSAHQQLEAFRRAKKLTYRQLGQLLGVHYSMAHLLCTGRRKPSLDLAVRIQRRTAAFPGGSVAAISWVPTEVA